MAVNWGASTLTTQIGALDAQADRLINRGQSLASTREDAKILKAGKDFESILLGNWLQQAEQSFATVPGGDGEDDEDGTKDQFQGVAMQALAGSLTASGGIGIAGMITKSLRCREESSQTAVSAATSSPKGYVPAAALNKSP